MSSWAWIGAVLVIVSVIGVAAFLFALDEIECRRLKRRVIQGAIDGLPVILAAREKMEARRRFVSQQDQKIVTLPTRGDSDYS